MKLYHFALFFVVIAIGFFMTAQIKRLDKMQEEGKKENEYDCLVAAVNAAVEVAFPDGDDLVSSAELIQTEEVFFQTLGVLFEGSTDKVAGEAMRQKIPCLLIADKETCYLYSLQSEFGYRWTRYPFEKEKGIPDEFFDKLAAVIVQYHNVHRSSGKTYRMEKAGKGIWEQNIAPPCVFAVYAPENSGLTKETGSFLYAASGKEQIVYYVTEDRKYHLPFCEEYKKKGAIACYSSQRESAEDGAFPCEHCLK